MPEPVEIALDPIDIRIAHVVAMERQLQNDAENRENAGGIPEEMTWTAHFEGACGECAVAKWAGVYWNGNLGDLKAPDVGGWEVKATARDNGRLLVRRNKLIPDRAYILVTGLVPRLKLRGWAYGREVGQEKYWDDPGTGRPAFFMPQHDLRPMKKSKKEIVLGA